MKENAAYDKARSFAIRIIRLSQYLTNEKHAFILADQILRSGTSIGANLAESAQAISRSDFTSKVYIALKECSETAYWLDLLHATDYLTDAEYASLDSDCRELLRILTATTKTLRQTQI